MCQSGKLVLVFYTVRHGRVANVPSSLFTNHLRSDGPFVPPTKLSRHDNQLQKTPMMSGMADSL